MKKIISILALAGLIAAPAFATDAEYSFREGVRTGVVTSILDVAATAAGNMTIATNLAVGGTATVTGAITSGATPVWTQAAATAPTNDATFGLTVTVNGTNYVVALYPN